MKTTILMFFFISIVGFCSAQTDVKKEIPTIKVRGQQEVFMVVDNMPMFRDSSCLDTTNLNSQRTCLNDKFQRYLNQNIIYPDSGLVNGFKCIVVLSFIVMPDGQLDSISVIRDSSGGYFGQESIRVINKMIQEKGPWFPGRQNGQVVAVRFNLPLKFKLRN